MPLEFPPVSNSPTTLVMLSVVVLGNAFLLIWALSLRKHAKESKYRSSILYLTSLVLAWSILNIFLPGIRYVPGTEYNPMDIVIGFLYDTFRHGYLGNALVILLGAVLIGFGRENKGTYGKALIFTGFFLVCGYLISSMNNGYYRSLIWTGSQDAAPYLETIFPSWSFAGNVLSQTPMIFLLYIGFKERQYPLLISGALSLSISIVFMLLNRSLPLFLQVSSSLVLFTLSLIVLHFMGKRREGADSEMI